MTNDELMVICAVRYCVGREESMARTFEPLFRQNILAEECDQWVRTRWPSLGKDAKASVKHVLAAAVQQPHGDNCGSSMQREIDDIWLNLYAWMGDNP